MSLSLRMARHSLVYGASILATQALGFLMIPIYTRAMPPRDYGALEILGRTSEVLGIFVMAGLRLAVVRFVQDPIFSRERGRVVGSALWIMFGMGLVFLGSLVLGAELVATQLLHNPGLAWAVRLMAAGSFFDLMCVLPMALLQADQKSVTFAKFNLLRFSVGLGLNLLMVAWFHMGLKGILLSTIGSAGTLMVILQPKMWLRERPTPDAGLARQLLKFGLPFVPGGLFLFVLNNGDRYFLARLATPAEVGLYALGYKLGMLVMYLFVEPVSMNWSAMMVEIHSRRDGPEVFSRMFTFIAAAYLCGGAAFSLIAPMLLPFVVGPAYLPAGGLIPWVCLGYFFWACSLFLDTPFYLARKTGAKPFLLGAAAAVNLSLYALLIPRYGMYGAAWATILSFAFFAGLTWWFARRHLNIPYAWGRLAMALGMAGAAVVAGVLAPVAQGWQHWALRSAIAIVLPMVVWRVTFSELERGTVRRALQGLLRPPSEAGHGA